MGTARGSLRDIKSHFAGKKSFQAVLPRLKVNANILAPILEPIERAS
jgi:hypothetical protein